MKIKLSFLFHSWTPFHTTERILSGHNTTPSRIEYPSTDISTYLGGAHLKLKKNKEIRKKKVIVLIMATMFTCQYHCHTGT